MYALTVSPAVPVGHSDDRGLAHRRVGVEHVLDLAGQTLNREALIMSFLRSTT